jgi:hypothetical protein
VLYYLSDVDVVCNILKSEFKIDDSLSVDKGMELKPNEFGYRSIHKILTLSDDRAKLREYRTCKDLKAEIQIRTVLQHAWASIAHALQYKNEQDAPSELHRRLYIISGLLELADGEFLSIKNELKEISKRATEIIKQGGENLEINAVTLQQYIPSCEPLNEMIIYLKGIGFIITDDDTFKTYIINYCNHIGIATIKALDLDLKRSLAYYRDYFSKFSKIFVEKYGKGILTFDRTFLIYLILMPLHKEKGIDFLRKAGTDPEAVQMVEKLIESIIIPEAIA